MARFLRSATAGALIALTPFTATVAAVRPGAAVPVSATGAISTNSSSYQDDDAVAALPWLPISIIAAAIVLGIYFSVNDKDGQGAISRG